MSFDLERFVTAQAPVIEQAMRELREGRKRTHWMWFVFPQIAGLGSSGMAQRYAIGSMDEARAYLAHAVLGPRLVACTGLVSGVEGRSAREILGSPDDVKFRSCLTLFGQAGPEEPVFAAALAKYFGGLPDPATMERV